MPRQTASISQSPKAFCGVLSFAKCSGAKANTVVEVREPTP